MAKLADAIHFDYIDELCEEILDEFDEDETTLVSVIGKYESIRRFIKAFMMYDEVNFDTIFIDFPENSDYYDEFIVEILKDEDKIFFDCTPAKIDGVYVTSTGNVLYLLDGTKQAVLNTCECDEVYFVIISEEERCDECDCVECNCSCEDKHPKDDWVINVSCNLDTKEANKLIDEMEQKLTRINDIFKEMNTMKGFFGW